MANIEFKITLDQLQSVNECFLILKHNKAIHRERNIRVIDSALNAIAIKLLKKSINKYDAKKPFKLSLAYYEAHYLELFLLNYNEGNYNSDIQIIIDILNQQLA